jgi:enoyl-[acyl-carrier-protein] reductase (NADH)
MKKSWADSNCKPLNFIASQAVLISDFLESFSTQYVYVDSGYEQVVFITLCK